MKSRFCDHGLWAHYGLAEGAAFVPCFTFEVYLVAPWTSQNRGANHTHYQADLGSMNIQAGLGCGHYGFQFEGASAGLRSHRGNLDVSSETFGTLPAIWGGQVRL